MTDKESQAHQAVTAGPFEVRAGGKSNERTSMFG
jgi:hypothetical protein